MLFIMLYFTVIILFWSQKRPRFFTGLNMANIYKRGDVYWYQIRLNGLRYRMSTKTDSKKLTKTIANTIEADLVRKRFSLPVQNNYNLFTAWDKLYKSSD